MTNPLILSKPGDKEPLLLYMAVSEDAISVVLVREESHVQYPIHYVSKRLLGVESRYPLIVTPWLPQDRYGER